MSQGHNATPTSQRLVAGPGASRALPWARTGALCSATRPLSCLRDGPVLSSEGQLQTGPRTTDRLAPKSLTDPEQAHSPPLGVLAREVVGRAGGVHGPSVVTPTSQGSDTVPWNGVCREEPRERPHREHPTPRTLSWVESRQPEPAGPEGVPLRGAFPIKTT